MKKFVPCVLFVLCLSGLRFPVSDLAAAGAPAYQPPHPNLTSISALADPNADRIPFWDESANAFKWLIPGSGLTITDTTIDAAGVGGGTVTAVTGTAPIVSSGGATPAISIVAATTSVPGSMSAADKTKLDAISGTNTGDQDLSGKANLASPTFTGTPLGPTAAVDTNTTQIATTAYVVGQGYAKLASPTFTGTPTLPTGAIATTQSAGNSTTALATTAFVTTAGNLKANLASPTFTGTPLAPTAAVDTNTTQIATTAYVVGQGYAKLASPTFTGTPTLPTGAIATTQSAGNSTTALATTAFVTTADNLKANLASPTFTGVLTISGNTYQPFVFTSSDSALTSFSIRNTSYASDNTKAYRFAVSGTGSYAGLGSGILNISDDNGTLKWSLHPSGGMVLGTSATDPGAGNFNISGIFTGSSYKVGANQVVGARDAGWTAMTGTANESTAYATGTVTLAELAGRVMAIQAALTTHGAIGP